jgi:hypothetical protein
MPNIIEKGAEYFLSAFYWLLDPSNYLGYIFWGIIILIALVVIVAIIWIRRKGGGEA